MKKTEPGRNTPCPCGSGKKYKQCCRLRLFDNQSPEPVSPKVYPTPGSAPAALDEIKPKLLQAMLDKKFESVDEAQVFANQLLEQTNQAPLAEFDGLSPDDMHGFLNRPFELSGRVSLTFPDKVVNAPIMVVFKTLVNAIDAGESKVTGTGNLPRKLCRDAALNMYGDEGYARSTRYGGINSEVDFGPINALRHTSELAGLLRKYKSKWIFSRKGRDIMENEGIVGFYPVLLRSFVEQYNWGFQDGYPELSIVQQSWLYSVRLLSLFGDSERDPEFYENKFLAAFPASLEEATDSMLEPERVLKNTYTLRTLLRFAYWFGLLEMSSPVGELFSTDYTVRATPLLPEIFEFRV